MNKIKIILKKNKKYYQISKKKYYQYINRSTTQL